MKMKTVFTALALLGLFGKAAFAETPTCSLKVAPAIIPLGGTVGVAMATTGQISQATIDGISVPLPDRQRQIVGTKQGPVTIKGRVLGEGGEGFCEGNFEVTEAHVRKVLILDLKSGWWEGDGTGFHNILLEKVTHDKPELEVEYHFIHADIDGGGIAGSTAFFPERAGTPNDEEADFDHFPASKWADFDQVWILSGSDSDVLDLPTRSDHFVKILDGVASSRASIFLGTGIGNFDHSNAVLGRFGLKSSFLSDYPAGMSTPVTAGTGQISAHLRRGIELKSHAIFAPDIAQIAETIHLKLPDNNGVGPDLSYSSDHLQIDGHEFTAIGDTPLGAPTIAVGKYGERKMVLEAGLFRFYAIFFTQDAETYKYLLNIFNYLKR